MRYNPALDGIRAFAILAVAAGHCDVPFARGGFIGVDIFFVLSGYLITRLLMEERARTGSLSFGRFYLNRAARLMPPLALMLAAYVAAGPYLFPDANIGKTALAAATYVSDVRPFFQLTPDPVGHTWSLGVEEKFYLIWPLMLVLVLRMRRTRALVAVSGLFVAASAWRIVMVHIDPVTFRAVYGFDTNAAALLAGVIIALTPWRPSKPVAFAGGIAASIGILVAVFAYRSQIQGDGAGSIIVYVMMAAVLAAVENENALSRALSWPPLVYIGMLSYSIYLWHYPMARYLRLHLPPELTFPLVMFASILIAAASWHFIEKPLKDWRHRTLRGSPAPAIAAE